MHLLRTHFVRSCFHKNRSVGWVAGHIVVEADPDVGGIVVDVGVVGVGTVVDVGVVDVGTVVDVGVVVVGSVVDIARGTPCLLLKTGFPCAELLRETVDANLITIKLLIFRPTGYKYRFILFVATYIWYFIVSS